MGCSDIMESLTYKRIPSFLIFTLVIILSFVGSIFLIQMGIKMPLIGIPISFIFLTFVPGSLIIYLLQIDDLSFTEFMLYSIGMSITLLISLGFIVNLIGFFLEDNIFSLIPLVFIIVTSTLILWGVCYFKCKDKLYEPFETKNFVTYLNKKSIFFMLLPFLAIIGSFLMNYYNNNILLLILIVLVSFIFLLVAFDKIEKKLFPFAIFTISLSLLWHVSLITPYLAGFDIHLEYFSAKQVIDLALWNFADPGRLNSMLSITILAPIYSIVSNADLIITFKWMYPLIYSLVPVGLYKIFQKQTNEKTAFFAVAFFMSYFVFFNAMFCLARQEIAEFFLVLLLLLMVSMKEKSIKTSFLFICFSFSLVVSHYSISYVYALLITAVFILFFIKYRNSMRFTKTNKISLTFLVWFLVLVLAWYLFTSESSPFMALWSVGQKMGENFFTEFLNPDYAQGLQVISKQNISIFYTITKYLQLLFVFFISVSFLDLLITKMFKINLLNSKKYYNNLDDESIIFMVVSYVICICAVAVPFFASSLEVTRLYHITLLVLSPLAVIGIFRLYDILSYSFKSRCLNKNANSLKIFAGFLVVFLLFNSGFIFEITNDTPSSIALSQNKDYPKFNTGEIYGATWISDSVSVNSRVYGDQYGKLLLREFELSDLNFWGETNKTKPGYIFLRSFNVNGNIYKSSLERTNLITIDNSTFFDKILKNKSEIYENGYSDVYLS